jgi:hypothetical protein
MPRSVGFVPSKNRSGLEMSFSDRENPKSSVVVVVRCSLESVECALRKIGFSKVNSVRMSFDASSSLSIRLDTSVSEVLRFPEPWRIGDLEAGLVEDEFDCIAIE